MGRLREKTERGVELDRVTRDCAVTQYTCRPRHHPSTEQTP